MPLMECTTQSRELKDNWIIKSISFNWTNNNQSENSFTNLILSLVAMG